MNFFTDIWQRLRERYALRFAPEGVRPLAETFWEAMLSIAACAVVLSIGWGVWELSNVLEALSSAADTSPPPPASFNRAALTSLVQAFDARSAQYQTLKNSAPPPLPDPGSGAR